MRSQPLSLRSRIRRYFEDNPTEYLTLEDLASKLDCTRQQAHWAVAALRSEGELQTLFVVAKARQEEMA